MRLAPRTILPLLCACVLAAVCVGVLAPAAWVDSAGAQIEPLDEVETEDPPGLGSIIGSPEAGPKTEDAGDRGGWAQLVLAVAVFGGVGFILTRVFRAASASDPSP